MRLKLRLLIFPLCCFLISDVTSSAQTLNLGASLPSRKMLDRYGLERVWWAQATLNPSRDKVRYLTVDEEATFVQATSGVVTAFDSETGKRLWAVQLGRRDHPSFRIVTNESTAMIVNGKTVYALDRFSGESLWQIRLPNAPSTSPAADDDNMYIGTVEGSVYAFNLQKIRELYEENRLPQWSYQTIRWRYKTSKMVTTPPIAGGRVINFASNDSSLYAVTALDRDLIYQFETDSPVAAPITYLAGFLYMADQNFNFFCVNAENGKVRWEFVSGLPVRKSARVIGDQVFLMPTRGGMFALSTSIGQRLWWQPKITDFIAASPKTLYTTDRVGNVVLLSREDGSILGALPLRHFSIRVPNDRTDRIFMATPTGMVVCIRERGREFPIYHKFPDRRPILPIFADENPPGDDAPPAGNQN